MKLLTASEMQEIERCTIEEFKIPSIILMENAGLGTVLMMEKELGSCANTFTCIFVGPGNNGGDGLVIGRHLHQRGSLPVFFFLVDPATLRGDAAVNFAIVEQLNLPFHVVDNKTRTEAIPLLYKQVESKEFPCYAVVDAILGTGINKKVSGSFSAAIDIINSKEFAYNVPVISVDCPSGLHADSGQIFGNAVQANYTATYGYAKPGHFIHNAPELVGKLHIINIGIPQEALEHQTINTELLDPPLFQKYTKNLDRTIISHKGKNGHLAIFAGNPGKTGAAILTGKGALRTGCGRVSLCCPESINEILETSLIEAMTIILPGKYPWFSDDAIDSALGSLNDKNAIVLGPGIGIEKETVEFVLAIYRLSPQPMVVDADAITILANNPDYLPSARGPRIFTPHPGELSRLLDVPVTEIQKNRLDAAQEACMRLKNQKNDAIVVLKGAGTIIASAKGAHRLINTSGNPGMATGGMGDVLSGCIGALLCQGLAPLDAAAAGVYLHGKAADSLYQDVGIGYTATEVADAIPAILREIRTLKEDT